MATRSSRSTKPPRSLRLGSWRIGLDLRIRERAESLTALPDSDPWRALVVDAIESCIREEMALRGAL